MGVVLALVLSLAAPSAPPEVAESWSELKADLPKDQARRAAALLRFAQSDRPALADRLRAAKEARGHAPRRALAFVVEARLHAIANQGAARARALANAAATLGRDGAQARKEHVLRVIKGDTALAALRKLVAKRERLVSTAPPIGASGPPPLAATEQALQRDVDDSLAAWGALDDPGQAAAARVALARLRATNGDAAGAQADLAAAVDGIAGRDHAAVRAEGLRASALLLEATGDVGGAALASLSADREAAINPKQPASRQTSSPYLKSKASLELCRKARAQGIVCGRAEQKKFGATLHYDFSQEPRGAFDPDVNAEVLADYDTLLQECIRAAAKANVPITQTVIELEWAVGFDGRVASYDLRPLRLRKTSYDACLRAAFELFRYPPYGGEMQHVRLSFEVGGDI